MFDEITGEKKVCIKRNFIHTFFSPFNLTLGSAGTAKTQFGKFSFLGIIIIIMIIIITLQCYFHYVNLFHSIFFVDLISYPVHVGRLNKLCFNSISDMSWFGLVWFLCFNGISTFSGYLMPKPFSQKNSSGTI